MAREPISKKTRFEVFKRDKFTCQYCGKKAPDVVLHIDHIKPVAEGGLSDILNLVTACVDCNSGKGARLLSSSLELDAQRQQLEELQERRDQIEMMLEWRSELSKFDDDVVTTIADHISERTGFSPNEAGRADIKRWLKRTKLEDLLNAIDRAFEVYLQYEGDSATADSWNRAFGKIPGVLSVTKQEREKLYLVRLFYIQGILRRRFNNKWLRCVEALEEMVVAGMPPDDLEDIAKRSDGWDNFCETVSRADDERRNGGK